MTKEKFRLKKSPHWISIYKYYIEHKNGLTLQLLSEKHAKTRKYFIHHFRWYNLPVITHRMNWRFADKGVDKDRTFFDVIDTELKAYLLGLMMSDGHISSKGCKLVFTSKDHEQCELFRKTLAPDLGLTVGTNDSRMFSCSSRLLINSLAKYGVVPRKSWKEITLDVVPKEFLRHTIRGIFDGDGWCSVTQERIYKSYTCHWGICGRSLHLMRDLMNTFKQLGMTPRREDRKDGLLKIMVSNRASLIILQEYLYKDSTYYLQRKSDKLTFFLSTPSKLERAKSRKLCNA